MLHANFYLKSILAEAQDQAYLLRNPRHFVEPAEMLVMEQFPWSATEMLPSDNEDDLARKDGVNQLTKRLKGRARDRDADHCNRRGARI